MLGGGLAHGRRILGSLARVQPVAAALERVGRQRDPSGAGNSDDQSICTPCVCASPKAARKRSIPPSPRCRVLRTVAALASAE